MTNKSTAVAPRMGISLPAAAVARSIDPQLWNALKSSIYRGASDDMILVALDYCKARKLDPIKKPVHIVQVWDSDAKGMVSTIWEGIASLRITAMRTGEYAGRLPTEYGADRTETFGIGDNSVEVTFPEWCQITLFKTVNGVKCDFPGPRVYWEEAFASIRSGAPNSMWKKRPRGQLEKCAEAAALRAAFPDELGGTNTADEMEGQTINDATYSVEDGDDKPVERSQSATLDDFATTPADDGSPGGDETIDVDPDTGEVTEEPKPPKPKKQTKAEREATKAEEGEGDPRDANDAPPAELY